MAGPGSPPAKDRGRDPNRSGTRDAYDQVIEGKLRAQAAWNEFTPEERGKANAMKAGLPGLISRTYMDLEYESPKGLTKKVVVPEGVEHGAYLTDYAAKNPPVKLPPPAEANKKKVPHSLQRRER